MGLNLSSPSSAVFWGLIAVVSFAQPAALERFDEEVGRAHLQRRVPPEHPPIAVAARVEGTVILLVIVSPAGDVEAAVAHRSIPLLDGAAIDAVKRWRFSPFEIGGRAVRAVVDVRVPFYLDRETAQAAEEVAALSTECRDLVTARRYIDAESPCSAAANLAARLGPVDRARAYHLAGQMLLGRGLVGRSIDAFRAEIKLRGSGASPLAHQALAAALASTGDIHNARREYERAEKAALAARKSIDRTIDHVRLDPTLAQALREEASATWRAVLSDHAESLRKAGLIQEAAKVERRLSEAIR